MSNYISIHLIIYSWNACKLWEKALLLWQPVKALCNAAECVTLIMLTAFMPERSDFQGNEFNQREHRQQGSKSYPFIPNRLPTLSLNAIDTLSVLDWHISSNPSVPNALPAIYNNLGFFGGNRGYLCAAYLPAPQCGGFGAQSPCPACDQLHPEPDNRRGERLTLARSMRSFKRPGVATRMSHPFSISRSCSRNDTTST